MLQNFMKLAKNICNKLTLNFKDIGLGLESCKIIAKIIK